LNGKPRSNQRSLDRLDEIINGLGECLPERWPTPPADGVRLPSAMSSPNS